LYALKVGNFKVSIENWIITEKHNSGVMSLTMNCAPVNALTSSNLMYLYNLLGDLEKDRSVHALVVNSSFKVFSAGINLKDAKDFTSDQQALMVKGLNFAFSKLFQFPKPVIVAAEGAAIAGGFFFILTSDYRVGGAKSMYGLAEARVGVDFPKPLLEIAKSVLSAADLRRLMQSGNPINSKQALTSGIIDEIVDTGEAFNRALIVAEDYSNIPKKTYSRIKRQVRGVSIDKINELMKNNSGVPVDGWYGDETRAAMDAMLK
jgi:enoyl-CoA hydratase/carnithine racemase